MGQNVVQTFSENLFQFLTGKPNVNKGLLIKKHMENLQSHGDFSFPNTLKSWHEYVDLSNNKDANLNLINYIQKDITEIIEESKKWVLQVRSVKEDKDRIYLFLERSEAIRVGLLEGLKYNEFISRNLNDKLSKVQCDPECEGKNSLTSLRLRYLCSVVQNLYSMDRRCKEEAPNVIVTAKSSSKSETDRMVLCGAVLNSKTGVKETAVSADEFIRLRQDEMTLIAQHKYGVRVATDAKWKEFIDHLGESAVAFELLQIRPNSAVKINFDHSSAGSGKGAAFVLYNCARLETIIKTFNSKVSEGSYPALPSFEDTDFSLLTQEDEWCLVFNFILGFPPMLANCVEVNDKTCEFRPHQICAFLCSMVRVFSQYYRRVRILTEPRRHLLPVMHARIHMLQVLNDTLKTCLKILNIKSVSQMYFCSLSFPLLLKLPVLFKLSAESAVRIWTLFKVSRLCIIFINLPDTKNINLHLLQEMSLMTFVALRYAVHIIQIIKLVPYPTRYKESIEKKCFVWKHKVHVIDPGILLWALARRDWSAEASPSAADKSRSALLGRASRLA